MSDENLVDAVEMDAQDWHETIERLRLSGPGGLPDTRAAYYAMSLMTICLLGGHRSGDRNSEAMVFQTVGHLLEALGGEAAPGPLRDAWSYKVSEKKAMAAARLLREHRVAFGPGQVQH